MTNGQAQPPQPGSSRGERRVVYGILAILVGGLGVHKFYMGEIGRGFIFLCLLSWNFGGILGVISGILALIKTDEEFYQKYEVEKSFI